MRAKHCGRAAAAQEIRQPSEAPKSRKKAPPPPVFVQIGTALSPDVWQNAVVLMDKPTGWTSFDVCGKLRRVVNMKKVSSVAQFCCTT